MKLHHPELGFMRSDEVHRGHRGKHKEDSDGGSEGSSSGILFRKPDDIVETARKGGKFKANGAGERKKCQVVTKGWGVGEGTASVFLTDSESELNSES